MKFIIICTISKIIIIFTVRGSTGISISQGPPTYETVSAFVKDDSKSCKAMTFSPHGRYFAWTNGLSIKVVLCETWLLQCEINRAKVQALQFSPKNTYLMTWEPCICEYIYYLFSTCKKYKKLITKIYL